MELEKSKLHILVYDLSVCFNVNFIKLVNKYVVYLECLIIQLQ